MGDDLKDGKSLDSLVFTDATPQGRGMALRCGFEGH